MQQTGCPNAPAVYTTAIGDTGPSGGDTVVLGVHFARVNGLKMGKEGAFQVVREGVAVLSSAVAEPTTEEDWEILVSPCSNYTFENCF